MQAAAAAAAAKNNSFQSKCLTDTMYCANYYVRVKTTPVAFLCTLAATPRQVPMHIAADVRVDRGHQPRLFCWSTRPHLL
eukprot:COSAG01_NODE_36333_length_519_cov_0.966667_1_plen_79_part_01